MRLTAVLMAAVLACMPAAARPGDANGDGRVDLLDLAIVAENWLMGDNYYLTFDGSGRVTIPDAATLHPSTGDWSAALWINHTTRSGTQNVLSKYEATPGDNYLEIQVSSLGKVQVRISSNAALTHTSAAVLTVGTWHHVAVTLDRDDADGLKVYLDGAYVDDISPVAMTGACSPEVDLIIGDSDDPAFPDGLIGSLDDVRIYTKELTAAEVAAIYNYGRGRKPAGTEPSLAWASNLDSGQGLSVIDLVGSNYGTISSLTHVTWTEGGVPFSSGGGLCTLDDVKDRLGLSTAEHDEVLESIIAGVGNLFEGHCNRPLLLTAADVTEYYTGAGPMLRVKRYPVVAITSIKEDITYDFTTATALTANTDYRLVNAGTNGIIKRMYID